MVIEKRVGGSDELFDDLRGGDSDCKARKLELGEGEETGEQEVRSD